MKVTTDKRVVQTGEHMVTKGQISDVPEKIARHWIAEKFARVPTAAELAAAEKPAKAKA